MRVEEEERKPYRKKIAIKNPLGGKFSQKKMEGWQDD